MTSSTPIPSPAPNRPAPRAEIEANPQFPGTALGRPSSPSSARATNPCAGRPFQSEGSQGGTTPTPDPDRGEMASGTHPTHTRPPRSSRPRLLVPPPACPWTIIATAGWAVAGQSEAKEAPSSPGRLAGGFVEGADLAGPAGGQAFDGDQARRSCQRLGAGGRRLAGFGSRSCG